LKATRGFGELAILKAQESKGGQSNEKGFDRAGIHPRQERFDERTGTGYHRRLQHDARKAEGCREENASREYSAEKIRAQIKRQKERHGWEFIFLGANIDAVEAAGRFGINADRAQTYHADSQGVALNFDAVGEAVTSFRMCTAVPEDWSDKIREDYDKRTGR